MKRNWKKTKKVSHLPGKKGLLLKGEKRGNIPLLKKNLGKDLLDKKNNLAPCLETLQGEGEKSKLQLRGNRG